MNNKIAKDVDSYIAGFPSKVQVMMRKLRTCIRKAAPGAEESISYMMPAYKFHGPLVYFGGYERHIGFYPTGSGIAPFQKDISAYKHSKGAVQFPLDGPLPLDLIERMVKYRVKENLIKAELKKQKKASE